MTVKIKKMVKLMTDDDCDNRLVTEIFGVVGTLMHNFQAL